MPTNIQPTPPNPSLISVLLIAKTRAGPRLVVHCPPFQPHGDLPEASAAHATSSAASEADDSDDSTHPGSSDDEYHVIGRFSGDAARNSKPSKSRHRGRNAVTNPGDRSGTNGVATASQRKKRAARSPRSASSGGVSTGTSRKGESSKYEHDEAWHSLFGFSADALAKMMAPNSRSWHKKKLEVNLEEICFLGCPIYCQEDGTWGKKRRKKKKTRTKEQDEPSSDQGEQVDGTTTEDEAVVVQSPASPKSPSGHRRQISSISSAQSSAAATSGASQTNSNSLLMFNVVFVMRPPKLEHQLRIKEMYSHVAKTLANALKDRQRGDGYVWNEAREIMALREKATENGAPAAEVWSSITSSSSLANALATTYDSITKSQIAHISLGAGFDLSLQIPQPTSTPFAPTPTAPQIPGLWLSSANLTGTYNDPQSNDTITSTSNDATTISPHAAILLLVPSDNLIKELAASGNSKSPIAGPLSSYIKHSVPTRTILQLSKILRLSLPDLQFLSLHLVRWRRARPIPPLHASHIYIVSPNADMTKLSLARIAFGNRFSALPDLVAILHKLGQGFRDGKAPAPWGTMIPSSDHKAIYMEALAWLVRGGWVCQLRTFAWVWVSSDVKKEVQKKLRREEIANRAKEAADLTAVETEDDLSEPEQSSATENLSNPTKSEAKNRVSSGESREGGRSNAVSIVLPQDHRKLLAPPQPGGSPSDTASVTSHLTALRATSPAGRSSASERNVSGGSNQSTTENIAAVLSPRLRARDPSKKTTSDASTGPTSKDVDRITSPRALTPVLSRDDEGESGEQFEPSLVLSPHKASTLESRWLEHIGEDLPDEHLREMWPTLVKHFDGRSAIEDISLIEGWKRKLVAGMIAKLGIAGKGGVLRIIRHW